MQHSDYVPLHLHTEYSLLDGAIRIDQLFERAVDFKLPAIAITDHGNLFGAIEFYRSAVKAGVKPIIGCEVYIAPESRFDKNTHGISEASYHLILLASNNDGYRNLMKLVSIGYLEGFYYRPRIDRDILAQYSGGLVGLSACMKGDIPFLLGQGQTDGARKIALEYKRIFGAGNFYLEIQDNELPEQKRVNHLLIELGKELHVPIVATGDCHYLYRNEARAHDILLCIQTGKNLRDTNRLRFGSEGFYFKSPEEIKDAFRDIPQAIRNTIEIAEKCNVDIKFGETYLPHYNVPEGYNSDTYLYELAFRGLEARFSEMQVADYHTDTLKYRERLIEELDIIKKMRFPGYFLVVNDFVQYAKSCNIPVGPGRGSAAGSLVAYALGITEIDPIRYGLLFERFLNAERGNMPDIDVDFCMDRRDKVIEYVGRKYGEDYVTQIITFGTMAARGAIRDVGRVLEIPYAEVDKIAKLIPNVPKITLKEALSSEPRLAELYEGNEKVRELIDIAMSLEGLARHASTHAAGVVISREPLTDYIPLYKSSDEEVITTQYDMSAIEKIGLVKFDFLGLKTLTVIDMAERLIRQRDHELGDFSIKSIPMDDRKTFALLSSGNTTGIFQLESGGMRDLIANLPPERFEDLIELVALFRPGPLGSGMVDDFIKRKKGIIPIKYELPLLEDILKETYGVILYQEQVMKIANILAGFTLGEADILRSAMGKKKPEEMEKQKKRFIDGARARGITEKKAEKIFDLMAYFAGYGFNKSHSAAYALIAYQTAYLKAHYPVEFMAALLSSDMDNTDKIVRFITECKEMGIDILPPDINESGKDFTVVGKTIRFGLAAVKNVGVSAIESIISAREKSGRFTSLLDFCLKIDLRKVNRRVIESLIKCGTFDSLGIKRSQLSVMLDSALDTASKRQKDRVQGQVSIFDLSEGRESTVESLPDIPEWSEHQLLSFEKETLGFYITGHPLNRFENELKRFSTLKISDLQDVSDKSEVTICGIVTAIKKMTTKKTAEMMATFKIEDLYGIAEVIVFPDLYRSHANYLSSDFPILITGEIDKTENGYKIKAKKIVPLIQDTEDRGQRTEHRTQNTEHRLQVTDRVPSQVELRIHSRGTTESDLIKLKNILLRHRGDCQIFIRIITPDSNQLLVAVGNSLKVAPSDSMISEIENLLGEGTVTIL